MVLSINLYPILVHCWTFLSVKLCQTACYPPGGLNAEQTANKLEVDQPTAYMCSIKSNDFNRYELLFKYSGDTNPEYRIYYPFIAFSKEIYVCLREYFGNTPRSRQSFVVFFFKYVIISLFISPSFFRSTGRNLFLNKTFCILNLCNVIACVYIIN